MDRLAELNEAQKEAVRTLAGPLLILAGAGSGKTRVITHRLAGLIRSGAVPSKILSVTFTNKAAREMRERATGLIGKSLGKRPLVCTFHSLCVRILREEISALGYPAGFGICDRGDQESMARSALREIRVGEKALKPGDLLAIISRWKNAGVHPEAAREIAASDREFLAAAAFRRYQAALKAAASVDFDDLLCLTHELFEKFPDVLSRQQARFSHVQIDEYQDTNGMQFAIVEALVRPHKNIAVVGDDDQSIYGWRGAEIRHILEFPRIFPGTRVIRLEDNYRSTDRILELANRLVRHNRDRHEKKLVPHKIGPNSVRINEYPDEEAEAVEVVREISWAIKSKGIDPGDVAILFRTNEQPRLFETELRRAKLPYVVLGSMSFFDRREIRDLLAYLKVLFRPEDEISLLRIINVPARGIGTGTVEKLVQRAVQQRSRVWNIIPEALGDPAFSAAAHDALAGFRALVVRHREQFEENPRQMSRCLKELIAEIDYEGEVKKQYDEPLEQEQRMASLGELASALGQYETRAADPTLAGFLEDSALTGRDEENDADEQLSQRGIKLMTLHSAKGLEFSRVFLVGMEEGILPHKRSLEDAEASVAEERRLCYVGMTRARDHLTLTRAVSRKKWGKPRPTLPSRFLFEMTGRPTPLAAIAPGCDEAEEAD
ncbi:MAG TPA: UvrD-helicase domain-containing protein [Planctomycetaceae bacterium]|nr:UvrD-helicase domain-containing protein [Planctomycetaceae bacterium]